MSSIPLYIMQNHGRMDNNIENGRCDVITSIAIASARANYAIVMGTKLNHKTSCSWLEIMDALWPMTADTWLLIRDSDGRVLDEYSLRKITFIKVKLSLIIIINDFVFY